MRDQEGMSDEQNSGLDKGDRAAITGGRNPKGVRGEIFWIGPNKYGEGQRYGLKSDDGETFWVDEGDIASETAAEGLPVPPPSKKESTGESFGKGDQVQIARGKGAGLKGEIFWVGDSRYGKGSRYGVKDESGETHWVDHPQVELVSQSSGGGESTPASTPPGFDDAPFPEDGFAEAAGELDELPPLSEIPFQDP